MRRNSVIAAIRELEHGFVTVYRKPGKTTVYYVHSLEEVVANLSQSEVVHPPNHTGSPAEPHWYPTKSADQVSEPLEVSEGQPIKDNHVGTTNLKERKNNILTRVREGRRR
jgi:hypothetical protein